MVKTILTPQFMQKVYLFCRQVSVTEWSGVLLYKTKNRSLPIDQWEIEVLDFYPMATGITTYTSFDVGVDHILYAECNGLNMEEIQMGLIHSHNSMGVFFSHEDLDELKTNANKFDAYLSLIVNNKGEVCAKVAQEVQVLHNYTAKNCEGKTHSFQKQGTKSLYTVECEIIFPDLGINQDWLDRLEEVKQKVYVNPKVAGISQNFPIGVNNAGASTSKWNNIDSWQNTNSRQGTFDFGNNTPKKKSYKKPTYKQFECFIKDEILDCKDDLPLEIVVDNYEAGYFDVELLLESYDELFGKTTLEEEIKVVGEVIAILQPYVNRNKDLVEVIKECQDYRKQYKMQHG